MFDTIIVGGGPAGLSAALILGRCNRKVLLVDNGKQRNSYSHALHGFITQDGVPPKEFLEKARASLEPYSSVTLREGEAVKAEKLPKGFEITLVDGNSYQARTLLIATGVMDDIPKIEGIMEFYGKSAHTCPYCDAWELTDQPIAVYGKGSRGVKLSVSMLNWTKDVILVTNGHEEFEPEELERLKKYEIRVIDKKIRRLEGRDGVLSYIIFEDNERLPRRAMFFNTPSFIKSKLLEQLGCEFNQTTGVETGKYESTSVPGVFVAGNICREVQLVIVAAGEGAEAAFGINTALSKEDRP